VPRHRPLCALESTLDVDDVTIFFDGRALPARAGEQLSAALLRAGILATTRSPKFRRPRGAYCLRGECGSCQVRIDGEPNLRACTTLVRDGLRVEAQNTWGPAGLDPTPLVDTIFRKGFDHHHLMVRPRIANAMMQRIARTMTGFGELPDATSTAPASAEEHRPEVLIIGAGSAGRAAATALEAAGIDLLTIDRHDRRTLEITAGDLPAGLLCDVGIFAAYRHEGLWAAAAAPSQESSRIHIVRPKHVILATGSRDPMLPIANNDLPGVVSARGLVHLLRRGAMKLEAKVIVVGEGEHAQALADELDAQLVAAQHVRRITGADAGDGIELTDGHVPCGLVALAPIPAPAHELAAQAGAQLSFDGHGFAVVTGPNGEVEAAPPEDLTPGERPAHPPWTLWACGDLCGWRGPKAAAADGAALAAALLRHRAQLGGRP